MNAQGAFSDATLEAMLRRRAERADPGDLRDAAFAALATTRPRRLGWSFQPVAPVGWPAQRGLAWVLVAAALTLALVGGSLAVGAWLQQHRPLSRVLPPGPASADILLPVSADEVWATDRVGRGLWHFVDGAWQTPALPTLPYGESVLSLARGFDGSLWIATGTTVWRLHDGDWAKAWDQSGPPSVARLGVAPDGTAWAIRGSNSIVGITPAGEGFRVQETRCPDAVQLLVVASDGTVYTGSRYSWSGLDRYDGHSCARVDPLGIGRGVEVLGLYTYAGGGLVADLLTRRAGQEDLGDESITRLEAGRWALVAGPAEMGSASGGVMRLEAVDPAGGLWRVTGDWQRIERFDGEGWRATLYDTQILSVGFSSDGVLWYTTPTGIQRLRIDTLPG